MTDIGRGTCRQTVEMQDDFINEVTHTLLESIPGHEDFVRKYILNPFLITEEIYERVRDTMCHKITLGVSDAPELESYRRLTPSFVRDIPNGSEEGYFLGLDIGGTNLRVALVEMKGGTVTHDISSAAIPMSVVEGKAIQLFDYMADRLYGFMEKHNLLSTGESIPLGFTFSFPVVQTSLSTAVLVSWTKRYRCQEAVGQNVGTLFQEALARKGDMNVNVVAILNDTVATLMAGTLQDKNCAIGMILGTGMNACYFESLDKVSTWTGDFDAPKQVAIDTQWNSIGNDGCLDFVRSSLDFHIDNNSLNKGNMVFEKMMCGMYLGEVVFKVLAKLQEEKILFADLPAWEHNGECVFPTAYVSSILRDGLSDLSTIKDVLMKLGIAIPTDVECKVVHSICLVASVRAAYLAAAGLACLLNKLDRSDVGIAVDGTMYMNHPLFHDLMMKKLRLLVKPSKNFYFVPCAEGSVIGAAVVAAVQNRKGTDNNVNHTTE